MNKIKKITIILLIILVNPIFVGCDENSFKENALKLRDVIYETNELLVISSKTNIVNDKNEITSTKIEFDKSKSFVFFNSQKHELESIETFLKMQIDKDSDQKIDSIYLLLLLNEFHFFITEQRKSNICGYLSKIKKNLIPAPSNWVQNKIFAPLFTRSYSLDNWNKYTDEQKVDQIRNYLLRTYNLSCLQDDKSGADPNKKPVK